MQNKGQKTALIIIAIVVVLAICIAIWWRIFNRNTEKTAAPIAPAPIVQREEFPVLPSEPPKLAGNVLVGTKVPTKFYLAKNGKRYVFPNDTKTYDTWKSLLPPMKKVSQDELESYPLGDTNVWYRPGARLIRIQSDPRVYAVAHGGVLREINDGNALAIFGPSWQALVDTLQDYYFTNYTVGPHVGSPTDYSIEAEQGKSTTIEQDKGL